jgi:hypothetical protein
VIEEHTETVKPDLVITDITLVIRSAARLLLEKNDQRITLIHQEVPGLCPRSFFFMDKFQTYPENI